MTSLRGRERECAVLGGLLRDVRRGERRSLIVHGRAGIGKTALLQYLIDSAPDLTLARAVGVESDIELGYAGLHQLCAPLLGRLASLPDPQARVRTLPSERLRWRPSGVRQRAYRRST